MSLRWLQLAPLLPSTERKASTRATYQRPISIGSLQWPDVLIYSKLDLVWWLKYEATANFKYTHARQEAIDYTFFTNSKQRTNNCKVERKKNKYVRAEYSRINYIKHVNKMRALDSQPE